MYIHGIFDGNHCQEQPPFPQQPHLISQQHLVQEYNNAYYYTPPELNMSQTPPLDDFGAFDYDTEHAHANTHSPGVTVCSALSRLLPFSTLIIN